MSRTVGAKCRICRREGMKLFLKGERCFTQKCAVVRRPYPPGQQGQTPVKLSNFGKQFREKQKARRMFGLTEQGLENYYQAALGEPGATGDHLLTKLVMRLDYFVLRSGITSSLNHARQLVNHGHVQVNGKSVDIPSFSLKAGDVVELKKESQSTIKLAEGPGEKQPSWLKFDLKAFKGQVMAQPSPDELTQLDLNSQQIVEYYSR